MKCALVACAALASTLAAGTAKASDADPWFGPDKALHFGVSVVLSAGGYAVSSIWLDTRTERAVAGGAFSLTLRSSGTFPATEIRRGATSLGT